MIRNSLFLKRGIESVGLGPILWKAFDSRKPSMENEIIKNKVNGMLADIINEVEPKNVLDPLIEKRIINNNNREMFLNEKTKKDRCRALMHHLRECTHKEAFIVFRKALEEDYHWIVERIDALDTDIANQDDVNIKFRESSFVTSKTKRFRKTWIVIGALAVLVVLFVTVFGIVCLRTCYCKFNCDLETSITTITIVETSTHSSTDPCRSTSDVCDCSDIKANGHSASGVYRIYVVDEGQHYYANVFCDMTTTNGAWTVFQRRKDGSEDFYKVWNEYENGFGNPNGEFWLGNNFLHLLTSKRKYRLRIDLEDFEGEKRYAEYSTFDISSSADKYRLRIGTYSGTAGDSLSVPHNGRQFTTKDNDNDETSPRNCAVTFCGAWWYSGCHEANLNGLYLRGRYLTNGSFDGFEGIHWERWHGAWYSLKTTEMKLSF